MRAPLPLSLVETIERHSARAWPAPIVIPMQGWDMRFAPHSSSRRINSLNPVAPVPGQFRSVLAAYLKECETRQVRAHVRLLPLASEDERDFLSSLGLSGEGATSVETIQVIAPGSRDPDVIMSSEISDAWLDAYIGAHDHSDDERAAVRAILTTVPHEMGFAYVLEDGRPVAAGRTALIGDVAGIYQIATAPHARRKGYGRRIVSALMAFAAARGAKSGYLQVEARNAPARALYGSLGFKPLYNYDYWPVPASIVLQLAS